ncbi:MAG: GxxExxY protein [Bacteroidales bacterium]|nr:GxxExxY protein [Bacteroidales bacterium]
MEKTNQGWKKHYPLLTDHESQVLNYLKATGYKLGILVNFDEPSLRYKRLVN